MYSVALNISSSYFLLLWYVSYHLALHTRLNAITRRFYVYVLENYTNFYQRLYSAFLPSQHECGHVEIDYLYAQ